MITPINKESWDDFLQTKGALSVAESLAIMQVCMKLKTDVYLELGSHLGKSGLSALKVICNSKFIAVDPIFSDREIYDEVYIRLNKYCAQNLTNNKLELISGYSEDVILKYDKVDTCFLDTGSHGDGLPMREVKIIGRSHKRRRWYYIP